MNISDWITEDSHKPLWIPFQNWYRNNNIVNPDDIKQYWECLLAGATTMYLYIVDGTIQVNN